MTKLKLVSMLLMTLALILTACGGNNAPQGPVLTETDVANLNLVTNALNNIPSLNTFEVAAQRTVTQAATALRQTEQTLSSTLNAKAQYVSSTLSAVDIQESQNYSANVGQQSGSRIISVIMADGSTYVKVDRALGALSGAYRSGWVDSRLEPRGIPGLESLDLETYKQSVARPLPFNIPREGVTSVRELEKTEVNGQPVRVFQIRIEARRAGDKTAFKPLLVSFPIEELMPYQAQIDDALANAMVIDLVVGVGEQDNHVYTVALNTNTTANITGLLPKDTLATNAVASVTQTQTAAYEYGSFNLPMVIRAP